MSDENPISLLIGFQDLPDPRVERRCDHKLIDIIVITVCAVIVGAESWVDVESFGKAKQGWLQTFLELPHGIPLTARPCGAAITEASVRTPSKGSIRTKRFKAGLDITFLERLLEQI